MESNRENKLLRLASTLSSSWNLYGHKSYIVLDRKTGAVIFNVKMLFLLHMIAFFSFQSEPVRDSPEKDCYAFSWKLDNVWCAIPKKLNHVWRPTFDHPTELSDTCGHSYLNNCCSRSRLSPGGSSTRRLGRLHMFSIPQETNFSPQQEHSHSPVSHAWLSSKSTRRSYPLWQFH